MEKLLSIFLIMLMIFCVSGCKVDYNTNESEIDYNHLEDTGVSEEQDINSEKKEIFEMASSIEELADRPEKVTKIYSFVNEFRTVELKEEVYEDPHNGNTIPYRIHIPKKYDTSKKYPIILFLHGADGIGTDNKSQLTNTKKLLEYNYDLVTDAIVISPQSFEWWNIDKEQEGDQKGTLSSVLHLLEEIQQTYSCDSNRIYVTGLSMGGYGTWNILEKHGDVFAAGIPICGGGNPYNAAAFKDIPIRIFHGTEDNTVPFSASQSMYNSIINAGGKKVKLIELPGVAHNAWDYAYTDRDTFCWMLAQNKETNPSGKYQYIPVFKIVDSAGNIIISDKDISAVYHCYDFGEETQHFLRLEFKYNSKKRLSSAYVKSKGKPFTVYCENQMVYSFTATKEMKDNYLYIHSIFDTIDFYEFYESIKK